MKKLFAFLLVGLCAQASEKGNVTVTNSVVINTPPTVVYHKRPGPKHPSVIAAHEAAARQREEDFVTCCCFFKIKKPT